MLRLLVTESGRHWALAWIPSFGLALCVTWMLNHTFASGSRNRRARVSFRHLVTHSMGSAIKRGVFSGIVMVSVAAGTLLMRPAVGAAAGLAATYLVSKYVVFSERPRI